MPRRRLAALIAMLALAVPSAALAQSAGDEQYQDPFGDEPSQSQEPEPAPDDGSQTAQTAPTPTPTPPSTLAAPATAPADELPRTGGDAGLRALGGAVLLAGGVMLRRRVT